MSRTKITPENILTAFSAVANGSPHNEEAHTWQVVEGGGTRLRTAIRAIRDRLEELNINLEYTIEATDYELTVYNDNGGIEVEIRRLPNGDEVIAARKTPCAHEKEYDIYDETGLALLLRDQFFHDTEIAIAAQNKKLDFQTP